VRLSIVDGRLNAALDRRRHALDPRRHVAAKAPTLHVAPKPPCTLRRKLPYGIVVPAGTSVAAVHGVASPESGEPRDGLDIDVKSQTIERRVERLETRVGRLEQLPQKVDGLTGQILQLRAEMGSEFSAIRGEIRDMGDGIVAQLRSEIREMGNGVVAQLRGENRDMREDIVATGRAELAAATARLRNDLMEQIGEMHAVAMKAIIDVGDRVDGGFAAMRQDLAGFRHQMLAGLKAIQNRLPR
jgi:hypothetical protein